MTDPDRALGLMLEGFKISRMLGLVAELGLPDLVPPDANVPARALASTKADPDALLRICRALAAFGVFTVTPDGAIGHSAMSRLLRTDVEKSQALTARFWCGAGNWAAWGALAAGLRTKESPHQAAWGMSRFDYMRAHPDEAAVYDARMAAASGDRQAAIAAAADFAVASTIVDVGGGNGALLRAILARHPTAIGIVYDRAHVVGAIKPDALLGGRISREPGDFLIDVPRGGDLYLLSWILHDWSDDDCLRILRNCRAAMKRGTRLMIAERVLEPDPAIGNPLDYLGDIQMMVLGGQERTVAQYAALLTATGFSAPAVTPTGSIVSLLDTRAI